MTLVYALIPVCLLALAIAVVPVLYGTHRHHRWEERERSGQPSASPGLAGAEPVVAETPHGGYTIEQVRHETLALVRRIEHLEKELFATREATVAEA
jgi:hypothetical protein